MPPPGTPSDSPHLRRLRDMKSDSASTRLAILGDVHGHLQLALGALARWQRETAIPIDTVLLAGDVGTFTDPAQLDSATRAHAKDNPCELEFLHQWSRTPQPPWLDAIFRPEPEGLGLTCPVVMVHGNHEGFAHLATLAHARRAPLAPIPIDDLPSADTAGHIRFLPPGWTTRTAQGATIAGVGGIEPGQRRAKYHPMAYIDEFAIDRLRAADPVDILLTHQGPAALQNDHGSPTLDVLLDRPFARFWFHGHSTPILAPTPINQTLIVPLGDLAFSNRGSRHGDPGLDGWALLDLHPDGSHTLHREAPPFWRDLRRRHWHALPGGLLVHPALARLVR